MDDKKRKNQNVKVRAYVIWCIAAVLIAWKWNLLGEPEWQAILFFISLSSFPIIMILFVRAIVMQIMQLIMRFILTRELGKMGYKTYLMICRDPEYLFLRNHPNPKGVKDTQRKIKEIFSAHPWMKHYQRTKKLRPTFIAKEY